MFSREPVRAAIYPFVLLTVAFLLSRGWIDQSTSDYIVAVAALLIGALAVETARSQVSPASKDTQ